MVTSTQWFGYEPTNIGPLTTAFTAAPTCLSGSDSNKDARIEVVLAEDIRVPLGVINCTQGPVPTECLPSGDVLSSLVEAKSSSVGQGQLPYFSPGIKCPDGWETVGRMMPSASGSGNGVFTETVTATGLNLAVIYDNILEAEETVAWCCPTDYKADLFGGCWSSIEPITSPVTYCNVLLPTEDILQITSYDGSIYSPPLYSVTPAVNSYVVSTATAEASGETELALASYVPGVALVFREGDLTAGTGGSGGGGAGTATGSAAGASGTGVTSAAVASLSVGHCVGLLSLGLSFVFGAGLVAPW